MEREELIALLQRSKEPIDISQYGRDGWASIDDVLRDIRENDIRPVFNEHKCCVDFYRHRVKAMCQSEGYQLLETERWYPKKERVFGFKLGLIQWKGFKTWRKIKERQEFSISETVKLGREAAIGALIRGVKEEWEIEIQEDQCEREYYLDCPSRRRKSRTYLGIWSIGWEEWATFVLHKRPCKWNPVFNDNGVLLFLEWFPLNHETRYRYWERKILSFCIRVYVGIYSLF